MFWYKPAKTAVKQELIFTSMFKLMLLKFIWIRTNKLDAFPHYRYNHITKNTSNKIRVCFFLDFYKNVLYWIDKEEHGVDGRCTKHRNLTPLWRIYLFLGNKSTLDKFTGFFILLLNLFSFSCSLGRRGQIKFSSGSKWIWIWTFFSFYLFP